MNEEGNDGRGEYRSEEEKSIVYNVIEEYNIMYNIII
jgi:hypothetical protein